MAHLAEELRLFKNRPGCGFHALMGLFPKQPACGYFLVTWMLSIRPFYSPSQLRFGREAWFWFSEQFCWLVLYRKLPCISYGSSGSCVSDLGRPAHSAIWHVSTGFFPPAWLLPSSFPESCSLSFPQYLPLNPLYTEPGKSCLWSPVPMSAATYTPMKQQLLHSQECLFQNLSWFLLVGCQLSPTQTHSETWGCLVITNNALCYTLWFMKHLSHIYTNIQCTLES